MASPGPRGRRAAIRCARPIRPRPGASASRARPCCASTSWPTAASATCSWSTSAGHPDLDQAAMEAVRRWRFEPARRGADAVAMWVLLPVEFRLVPSEEIHARPSSWHLAVSLLTPAHRDGPATAATTDAAPGRRRGQPRARRAHPDRDRGPRGAAPRARRHRGGRPAEDRAVARGQPEGRARLRARRVRAAALRRRGREPDLDPRLRAAQQLPPARHQHPDRRLPLRQRRRVQRLRVARAPDHQAHRGLQGRQRAALRRLHPGRRHQPRQQDRLRRRRSSSCGARPARSASSRTTWGPARSTARSISTSA